MDELNLIEDISETLINITSNIPDIVNRDVIINVNLNYLNSNLSNCVLNLLDFVNKINYDNFIFIKHHLNLRHDEFGFAFGLTYCRRNAELIFLDGIFKTKIDKSIFDIEDYIYLLNHFESEFEKLEKEIYSIRDFKYE